MSPLSLAEGGGRARLTLLLKNHLAKPILRERIRNVSRRISRAPPNPSPREYQGEGNREQKPAVEWSSLNCIEIGKKLVLFLAIGPTYKRLSIFAYSRSAGPM